MITYIVTLFLQAVRKHAVTLPQFLPQISILKCIGFLRHCYGML